VSGGRAPGWYGFTYKVSIKGSSDLTQNKALTFTYQLVDPCTDVTFTTPTFSTIHIYSDEGSDTSKTFSSDYTAAFSGNETDCTYSLTATTNNTSITNTYWALNNST